MHKIIKFSLFLVLILAIFLPAFFVYGCNYHAYRDCVGTAIFWYDSCTNREDLYQDCAKYNLTCKYGQCVEKQKIPQTQPVIPQAQPVISEAQDQSQQEQQNNQEIIQNNNLSISFFIKGNYLSQQWEKTAKIGKNQDVYFMVVLNNNGQQQVNENVIAVNIPNEISYLGNLKVDDVAISGDIVSGVNIGSIQAMQKKTITFEGKTQSFETQEEKQASVFINLAEPQQSDSVSISFDSTQNNHVAELSQAEIFDWVYFIKKWFMWIVAGIVLIFLFTIIFKRISGNV